MTFAHIVYSKLNSNDNAVVSYLPSTSYHPFIFVVLDSKDWNVSTAVLLLSGSMTAPRNFKDIDVVGVLMLVLFLVNLNLRTFCITILFSCHCDGGDPCDQENGRCPNGRCSPGWKGAPICDEDEDECELDDVCPSAQPDCLNTPGSYLCICFEYDEANKRCKGEKNLLLIV
ncbi:unnamed protein product [Cylicostephanus goldi]|uniref:EGF-like calcium-binding domain-containing protein n=1 Tax=Cylicostephanus goldi TaxID=71465 RepID=A0A3P7MAU3_CYLGO|nr:unnamed protein product [Cylicostephanus goldi]